jgi:hypothetical protein
MTRAVARPVPSYVMAGLDPTIQSYGEIKRVAAA